MKLKRHGIGRKLLIGGAAGIIVAAAAFGTICVLGNRAESPQTAVETPQETPPPVPVSIEANTLFLGDIYWGRYLNEWSMASELKTAYPFSRLNEFERGKYDAWIANLECPTVPGFTQTSAQEEATLSFNCNPEYLAEAAKWFPIVSLANNHTDNRGADGFEATKEQLDKHDMQYFGHYDPAVTEDACEVVALPVRVTYSDDSVKPQHLPITFCGYNGVFKIPPAASLAEIATYAEYMPVISLPHMGAEYRPAPDQLKTTTYRAMIDQGADMVLGGHPHWVQTSEAYEGKLIVYSMGNFIFDQQGTTELTRSASINVVMNTTDSSDVLAKWLALGKTCAVFRDNCLAQAKQQGLKKLTMNYTYGVVAGSSANKITKPATDAEAAAVLERLNWQDTMNKLSGAEENR